LTNGIFKALKVIGTDCLLTTRTSNALVPRGCDRARDTPVKEVATIVKGQVHSSREVMLSLKHEESKPSWVVFEVNDSS
jgi:hypothetical protein